MKTKKVECVLRFKTIETDEECEQLRKALGILDVAYTVKRMKDIDAKITALKARGTPS